MISKGRKTLGIKLRQMRREKCKTQAETAEALGITVSFYSAIEVVRKPMPMKLMDRLVTFLEIDEEEEMDIIAHAAESAQEVKINLRDSEPGNRDLALMFARRFPSLNREQANVFRRLLTEM